MTVVSCKQYEKCSKFYQHGPTKQHLLLQCNILCLTSPQPNHYQKLEEQVKINQLTVRMTCSLQQLDHLDHGNILKQFNCIHFFDQKTCAQQLTTQNSFSFQQFCSQPISRSFQMCSGWPSKDQLLLGKDGQPSGVGSGVQKKYPGKGGNTIVLASCFGRFIFQIQERTKGFEQDLLMDFSLQLLSLPF